MRSLTAVALVGVLFALALVNAGSCQEPSPAGVPPGAATAHATQLNLAYDAISKVIISGTPPPIDNFDADAELITKLPPFKLSNPAGAANTGRAIGALSGLLSLIPAVGAFVSMGASMAAGAAANAAQQHAQEEQRAQSRAIMAAGRRTGLAYYHGWTRTTAGQHATIVKPEQGLTISLDYGNNTYSVERDDPAMATYTVDATPPPTATIVGTPSASTLAPASIDHRAVRGYRLSGSIETTQDLGFCNIGTHAIEITEYVSDLPDPDNHIAKPPDPSSVLNSACQPTTTASSFEPGKLVLYRSTAIRPSIAGDLILVTELGNLRTLTPQDLSTLFSTPPDFTEEHD